MRSILGGFVLLFIAVINEDGDAIIVRIYEKHYKKMLFTATGIVGEAHAEEAVQDVFVKLLKDYRNNIFPDLGDKPGLFFVIVVRNHSLNLLKKEKRFKVMSLDDEEEDIFASQEFTPEEALLDAEADEMLVSLIRQLKPAARQLLEYKYIAEYTNSEIADILGISQTAVSTRINKAKKRLKELLEAEES